MDGILFLRLDVATAMSIRAQVCKILMKNVKRKSVRGEPGVVSEALKNAS